MSSRPRRATNSRTKSSPRTRQSRSSSASRVSSASPSSTSQRVRPQILPGEWPVACTKAGCAHSMIPSASVMTAPRPTRAASRATRASRWAESSASRTCSSRAARCPRCRPTSSSSCRSAGVDSAGLWNSMAATAHCRCTTGSASTSRTPSGRQGSFGCAGASTASTGRSSASAVPSGASLAWVVAIWPRSISSSVALSRSTQGCTSAPSSLQSLTRSRQDPLARSHRRSTGATWHRPSCKVTARCRRRDSRRAWVWACASEMRGRTSASVSPETVISPSGASSAPGVLTQMSSAHGWSVVRASSVGGSISAACTAGANVTSVEGMAGLGRVGQIGGASIGAARPVPDAPVDSTAQFRRSLAQGVRLVATVPARQETSPYNP